MPCPYAGGADSRETVDREDFLRSTLVIGGRDALQATLMRYGPPELDPAGSAPDTGGQYDWAEAGDAEAGADGCPVDHEAGASHDGGEDRDHDHEAAGAHGHDDAGGQGHDHGDDADAGGCPVDHAETGAESADESSGMPADSHDEGEYEDFESDWPAYHVVYRLSHEGDDPAADRRRLTDALAAMTEQVGWGREGVTWAVGYAPEHLEDAGDSVPAPLRVAPAGGSVAPDGGREVGGDCLLHLASDEPRRLLVAEALLWDGTDGLGVDASLEETVEDAYPRPQSAPGRLVTISPHGVDAPSVDGDAVVQLSSFEEERPEARGPDHDEHDHTDHDTADDAAECPVDHGDGDDAHDHADGGENGRTNAVDLRHLNPASPGVLRVGLHSPADSDPDAERYYLPAAANRSVTAGE